MTAAYSAAALCLGFLLDALLGDPRPVPHIVRGMGHMIALLERFLLKKGREGAGGALLVAVMLAVWGCVPAAVLFFLYRASLWAGFLAESLLCFQLLAARSLQNESMKVLKELRQNDVAGARKSLSMIVGRDTDRLEPDEIARATVETVAENASDGVIAPLFYIALGGGALGCLYKAVNTMDSMIGYKNDRYLLFGRAAARLDDFANLIPARLAALLMIACAIPSRLDVKGAFRVWRRDRRNHASPNSAQTESVCAGALGVRLGGGAYYFGKLVEKPTIGDDTRPVEAQDIARANRLMYMSAVLMLLLSALLRGIFIFTQG